MSTLQLRSEVLNCSELTSKSTIPSTNFSSVRKRVFKLRRPDMLSVRSLSSSQTQSIHKQLNMQFQQALHPNQQTADRCSSRAVYLRVWLESWTFFVPCIEGHLWETTPRSSPMLFMPLIWTTSLSYAKSVKMNRKARILGNRAFDMPSKTLALLNWTRAQDIVLLGHSFANSCHRIFTTQKISLKEFSINTLQSQRQTISN